MPRTTITPSVPFGPYPVFPIAANSADIPVTAADPTNKNQAPFGTASRLIVLVHNGHAATDHTITITSAPDGYNRVGDISSYTVSAGEIAAFAVARGGWRQPDGMLYFEADHTDVQFAVIQL